METTHGHVYAEGDWVGWASFVKEPFSHTLSALVFFLKPEISRRWESFDMQVVIQVGEKRYLRCSNIRKIGGATLRGQVWHEYLISYGEYATGAIPVSSLPPLQDSSQ